MTIVIYEALCFDVAQGRMNGAPNETRTHSCRFATIAKEQNIIIACQERERENERKRDRQRKKERKREHVLLFFSKLFL